MTLRYTTAIALAAIAIGGAASAATLNGTFNIDIYNYDAGGSSAAAAATAANVAVHGPATVSVIYTGDLNFSTTGGGSSIQDFLDSGGGTIIGPDLSAYALSAGSFGTTTLFDITFNAAAGISGTISHDDGISLYNNGFVVADSSNPTVEIDTDYSLSAGSVRLIYSAANGDPEILNVERERSTASGSRLASDRRSRRHRGDEASVQGGLTFRVASDVNIPNRRRPQRRRLLRFRATRAVPGQSAMTTGEFAGGCPVRSALSTVRFTPPGSSRRTCPVPGSIGR